MVKIIHKLCAIDIPYKGKIYHSPIMCAYIHIYIYMYLFNIFSPTMVYHRVLNIVFCAVQ